MIAALLLPVTAQATDETLVNDEITADSDSLANAVDDEIQVKSVADTTQSELVWDEPHKLDGRADDATRMLGWSEYRTYRGPDFRFFKNTTNSYYVEPYTFMQDQTWVGIPVFLAGLIAKSEKAAFRQDYNNPNTKIRLIKYNFHSEIDNYTQFSGIALTAGLKLAGVEGRSSWPRLFASSLASYGVMAAFVNGIKYTASGVLRRGTPEKNKIRLFRRGYRRGQTNNKRNAPRRFDPQLMALRSHSDRLCRCDHPAQGVWSDSLAVVLHRRLYRSDSNRRNARVK